MARGQNLTINRGTTIAFDVNYMKDGVAASLVGATIYFTVKDVEFDNQTTDSTALISKEVTSHTDAAAGQSQVVLSANDTWVTPGNHYYDLVIKEADNTVYEVAEGRFKVDGAPTNRSAQ